MAKSQVVHEEPIMGSHDLPYRETGTSGYGHYPWWAFHMYIIFFIAIVLISVAFLLDLKSGIAENKHFPYKRKDYFFTITERKFYEVLKEVANELDYELFSKVRWADIIYSDRKGREWYSDFGRIKSKHVDFLLCDKKYYAPRIIVELDDPTHIREDRVARDDFQTEAFITAGLRVIRFKPQFTYSKEEIKAKLLK